MLDTIGLNPPAVLKDMEEATKAIHFTMGSDAMTGSLLRTLAASKPSGNLLELGTGTGLGTAWILDGMGSQAQLISVDRDETAPAIARRFLGNDPRVTFCRMDGTTFLADMRQQGRTFDFIFADTWPGKFSHREDALQLLAPGGLYIIDDFTAPYFMGRETRHERLSPHCRARSPHRPAHHKTQLVSGLIVATKIE